MKLDHFTVLTHNHDGIQQRGNPQPDAIFCPYILCYVRGISFKKGSTVINRKLSKSMYYYM